MRNFICLLPVALCMSSPYYRDALPACRNGFCFPAVRSSPATASPVQVWAPTPTISAPVQPVVSQPDPEIRLVPGPPGKDGKDGKDGRMGLPGSPGKDAVVDYDLLVARVLDRLPPMRVLVIQDGVVVGEPRDIFLGGEPLCISVQSESRKE